MRAPKRMTYRNDRYGFTLSIPGWWRSYCVISKTRHDREAEYELHFKFKYKGKVYEDIFTILVYRMTQKQWAERGYEDSPLVLMAASEGRVFAYITPEELPYAFVNKKTGDYDYKRFGTAIKLLKRMVNDEVPVIAQSIRFSRKASTVRSTPYRARGVWRPGGCRRR